jgi:hypothetical protein
LSIQWILLELQSSKVCIITSAGSKICCEFVLNIFHCSYNFIANKSWKAKLFHKDMHWHIIWKSDKKEELVFLFIVWISLASIWLYDQVVFLNPLLPHATGERENAKATNEISPSENYNIHVNYVPFLHEYEGNNSRIVHFFHYFSLIKSLERWPLHGSTAFLVAYRCIQFH